MYRFEITYDGTTVARSAEFATEREALDCFNASHDMMDGRFEMRLLKDGKTIGYAHKSGPVTWYKEAIGHDR